MKQAFQPLRILLVGNFRYHFYESAVAAALESAGCIVSRFVIDEESPDGLVTKIEEHLSFPVLSYRPVYRALNRECKRFQPDYIFVWRGVMFTAQRLAWLKSISGAKLISFNNDDPFSERYGSGSLHMRLLWRNFVKAIPQYDINLVFRPHNLADYQNAGSKRTLLFPPYYLPSQVSKSQQLTKKYDLVFIGHSSPERLSAVNALLAAELPVTIFGTGWPNGSLHENYTSAAEVESVYGEAYYETISRSKVALAFLSKLNRDVYTRRSFEIPACGTVMLSERTPELVQLYKEDEEAVFFSSEAELIEKANWLLGNSIVRQQIAVAGKRRAELSGYSVQGRVDQLLRDLAPA